MKRSRAPSSNRSNSVGARQTRGTSSSAQHAAHHSPTSPAAVGHLRPALPLEELHAPLEADAGLDNLADRILSAAENNSNNSNNSSKGEVDGAAAGNSSRGRRRSNRGGSKNSRAETSADSAATPLPAVANGGDANGGVKVESQAGGGRGRKARGGAEGSSASGSGSVGNGAGTISNGNAPAAANDTQGPENMDGEGLLDDKGNCKGEADAGGGGAGSVDGGGGPPPAKKPKKKYIRNPETHKVYRARMESELAQARALLENANTTMVQLARDYKRQQAIIEKYRMEDNSLISTSQLTQSQPTNQQQQQQQLAQAQAQGLQQQAQSILQQPQSSPQQHQMQQVGLPHHVILRPRADSLGGAGGAAAGAGAVPPSSLEVALLECSQDSMQEPEMSQLSQDVGMTGLSQMSGFSLNMLDTEEPLSQVNNWIAAFHDSQEAWSLDDILEAEEPEEGAAHAGELLQGEREETSDSVEAMALAPEALSPPRHNQGTSSSRPLSASTSSTPAPTTNLSPMRPPPPQLVLPGGGRSWGGGSPMKPIPAALLAGGPDGIVRVGVACLVTTPKKPGCVLVGRRKGSFGAGTLALPGGHLEVGEEWSSCASREVLEETGLQLETPTFAWVINTPHMEGGKHYVTIFMLAAVLDADQEPKLMEPDKCEGWFYKPWKSLVVRKSKRGGSGGAGSRELDRLFQPLAVLRATSYDPFRGVL